MLSRLETLDLLNNCIKTINDLGVPLRWKLSSCRVTMARMQISAKKKDLEDDVRRYEKEKVEVDRIVQEKDSARDRQCRRIRSLEEELQEKIVMSESTAQSL